MPDCDDLIYDFDRLTRQQIGLALTAATPPVAAMHIDLALFGAEQARYAETLCRDAMR